MLTSIERPDCSNHQGKKIMTKEVDGLSSERSWQSISFNSRDISKVHLYQSGYCTTVFMKELTSRNMEQNFPNAKQNVLCQSVPCWGLANMALRDKLYTINSSKASNIRNKLS
jgi:hypothetical protein